MMTGQDVVNRVRNLIQDTVSGNFRWDDPEMIDWVNDAQQETIRRRPDALSFTTLATTNQINDVALLTETLQIGNPFRSALVDYVTSRALEKDSDDPSNLNRANYYLDRFIKELN